MVRYTVESTLVHVDDEESKTEKTNVYLPKLGDSIDSSLNWIKVFKRSLIFYAWLDQDNIPLSDLTSNDVTGESPNMISSEKYLELVKKVSPEELEMMKMGEKCVDSKGVMCKSIKPSYIL